MQFLVDFFPLLLFLGTYLYYEDIYIALMVLMVAMPVAFLIKWRLNKEIDKMLLGSTALLLVLGTVTLMLRDPTYLYWKPTVFYWVVAVVFLGSQFIGEKPVVKRLFGPVGEMPANRWRALNYAWIVFFVASGFLNLYVAYNYSEKFWVNFKVFGFTAIMFLFIIAQTFWMMRHIEDKEPGQQEND